MKPENNFEDFLKMRAMKDYHGDKEHWEDYFSQWLEDNQERVIDFADLYAQFIRDYYERV